MISQSEKTTDRILRLPSGLGLAEMTPFLQESRSPGRPKFRDLSIISKSTVVICAQTWRYFRLLPVSMLNWQMTLNIDKNHNTEMNSCTDVIDSTFWFNEYTNQSAKTKIPWSGIRPTRHVSLATKKYPKNWSYFHRKASLAFNKPQITVKSPRNEMRSEKEIPQPTRLAAAENYEWKLNVDSKSYAMTSLIFLQSFLIYCYLMRSTQYKPAPIFSACINVKWKTAWKFWVLYS